MKDLLAALGGGEMQFGDAFTAKAVIANDTDKGLFVLKLKDSAITESINYLKSKGLFPDKTEDSDDEFIFGDDDFPSADAEEEKADEPAEPEEVNADVAAEEGGEPYPDITYGAATPESLTDAK